MRLKFAFQPFIQLRQLLLTLCFDFLTKFALDASTLLQIARFELIAGAPVQAQSQLTQSGFGLNLELLTASILPFAQDLLLFRVHLQPAFGVPAESLPLFRRKLVQTIASGLKLRMRVVSRGDGTESGGAAWWTLRRADLNGN
jgi:hypothetical protein